MCQSVIALSDEWTLSPSSKASTQSEKRRVQLTITIAISVKKSIRSRNEMGITCSMSLLFIRTINGSSNCIGISTDVTFIFSDSGHKPIALTCSFCYARRCATTANSIHVNTDIIVHLAATRRRGSLSTFLCIAVIILKLLALAFARIRRRSIRRIMRNGMRVIWRNRSVEINAYAGRWGRGRRGRLLLVRCIRLHFCRIRRGYVF